MKTYIPRIVDTDRSPIFPPGSVGYSRYFILFSGGREEGGGAVAVRDYHYSPDVTAIASILNIENLI